MSPEARVRKTGSLRQPGVGSSQPLSLQRDHMSALQLWLIEGSGPRERGAAFLLLGVLRVLQSGQESGSFQK
ncbi:hypothetical protein NDU88_006559 [Pleurodeles waltl]|uniref:Uncharacterized protein n=1 Tax=Pleurodeles waltl TaxID=8319 RepID=A0AAV7SPU7_PLEWA|nr:hypothetical protein NDU88_006559 [Pleurodeles waltl]